LDYTVYDGATSQMMAMSFLRFAVALGIAVVVLALGFFVLVPALVKAGIGIKPSAAKDWREKVLLRYQRLAAEPGFSTFSATFAWIFAWFKLRLDPMFGELPQILKGLPEIRNALDIGCGNGIAACAILEWRPELKVFGIDPTPSRVRAASAAFGSRGEAFTALAPDIDIPGLPNHFDAVFILDVIHFLPCSALELTLQKIRRRMDEDGHLVIRAIIPPTDGGSWPWRFARIRRKLTGGRAWHRSVETIHQMLAQGGFNVEKSEMSGGNPELFWFIATARRDESAETSPG
jgi:SAM-dependent methyltransferase